MHKSGIEGTILKMSAELSFTKHVVAHTLNGAIYSLPGLLLSERCKGHASGSPCTATTLAGSRSVMTATSTFVSTRVSSRTACKASTGHTCNRNTPRTAPSHPTTSSILCRAASSNFEVVLWVLASTIHSHGVAGGAGYGANHFVDANDFIRWFWIRQTLFGYITICHYPIKAKSVAPPVRQSLCAKLSKHYTTLIRNTSRIKPRRHRSS